MSASARLGTLLKQMADAGASESDFLRFLPLARELIEQAGSRDRFPTVVFYGDWSLHPQLDRGYAKALLRRIQAVLDRDFAGETVNHPVEISRVLDLSSLRTELRTLLADEQLPADLVDSSHNWNAFVQIVVDDLLEKPIIGSESDAEEVRTGWGRTARTLRLVRRSEPMPGLCWELLMGPMLVVTGPLLSGTVMTDAFPSTDSRDFHIRDSVSQPRPRRDALEVLQNLAGASAVIGAAAYAFARLALNEFYRPLGVTPEEAGWDATTVLARFAFPFTILLLLAIYLAVMFQKDKLSRGASLRNLLWEGWGPWLLILVVIGLGIMLIRFARERVDRLRRGEPLAVYLDSAMPISAPCVHAFWIDVSDPERMNLPAFGPEHRLLFLGASGDMAVLYDPTVDAALRVPKGHLFLQTCAR